MKNLFHGSTVDLYPLWHKAFKCGTQVPRCSTVPRFLEENYGTIDQYDGTTSSEEAGGYVKDPTNGCDINFMIIEKSAVIQFEKHVAPKIITPEQNQSADAYKFGYRNVGIADVYENKVAGIYLHHKAKA